MELSDFELASISFSVATDSDTQHDFTNVHHGFLSLKEVIPGNWVVSKTDLAQHSSSLQYENGVQLAGNPREFQVTQTGGLTIEEESAVLRLMTQYLTSISPDTFRIIEVQLDLQARHENPNGWIIDNLIVSGLSAHGWKQVQPALILSAMIENMITSYAFVSGRETNGENHDSLLKITIHALRQPFSSSEELVKWCYDWSAHKKTLLQNLAKLIENQNDTTRE